MTRGEAAERRVLDRLRAALPAEYRLYPNVEWVGSSREGGPAYDGEADLVIAHIDRGILVVEVKSGEPRKDARGRWWIGDHELPRSPFVQAEDSKHALVRKLTALPDWPPREPPFAGHAVALPDADLASLPRGHALLGPEAPPELVIDATALETPESARAAVDRAYRFWLGDRTRGFSPGPVGMRLIEELLASEHELHRLVRGRIADDRPALLEATRDQERILNQNRGRRRLEIVGPAGSGKSMIAAAKARRLAREGFRTLLVCFNQRLATDLRHDLGDAVPGGPAPLVGDAGAPRRLPAGSDPIGGPLVVTTFHRLCELAGSAAGTLPERPEPLIPHSWWTETLPGALEAAIAAGRFEPFHAVVVDEGQDFERSWLDALIRLVASPADDVLWIFHDPGQAVIRDDVVGELGLDRVELYENLRNPGSIAALSSRFYRGPEAVVGLRDEGPAGAAAFGTAAFGAAALGADGAPHGRPAARHRIVEAEPGDATLEALRRELHRLIHDERVAPFRIAVLAGTTATDSAVWKQRRFGNAVLVNSAIDDDGRSLGLPPEAVPDEPDEVLFETIRRFKGLERDVVILVELSPEAHRLDELLYTGLTRATTWLTVIAPPALAARLRDPRG
jgi:hypothetical protein